MKRSHPSGAQKKKKTKQVILLKKTLPKVNSFFCKRSEAKDNTLPNEVEDRLNEDKEENETSETAGDNHETTVVTNSCAFEREVEDRVHAAEMGTDEQELTEGEAAEGGVDKQQEPRDTLAGGSNPYSNDPGVWGDRISEQIKSYWATLGPKNCQNKDCDFSASERQYKHQRKYLSKVNFQ